MLSNIKILIGRSVILIKKVFIDTNPLIYLTGMQEPYYEKVLNFFADCITEDAEFYTSTITDAEFLIKPFADNNIKQIENYKQCLKRLGVLKIFINEQIAEKAALLRAKYTNIKLADALQLAASIDCNCDIFFTNDKQLKQVTEAKVMYLGDL